MPWVDASDVDAENPATEAEIAQVIDYSRRRAKPRFYAGENFPRAAVDILRSKGAKVVTAQEVRHRGHPTRIIPHTHKSIESS
jgi:hypothetical protein